MIPANHCLKTQHVPGSDQPKGPAWLIDVKEGCLFQGNHQHRYIALSYTWHDSANGIDRVNQLKLLTSNMSSMLAPNVLKRNTSQLPAVIQHAIELTGNIGERYLWVGRLCIVQDGPQNQFECMRMDEIYSGAYVTIVAAAEGGLFRNYGKSSKRSVNKTSHKY
ncbi:uncharacterized protein FRV6_15472 [Fusarium oxysporum]|uniref:Heterokaryon incompatibility domain-containing protein n=1 Tax=Fusarium oxysporum TaxID=5507 RepID=A0A2H3TRU7_FUSOX|nr:uncharacterized protein FRV6_15472 [Fusarium oxysporum]